MGGGFGGLKQPSLKEATVAGSKSQVVKVRSCLGNEKAMSWEMIDDEWKSVSRIILRHVWYTQQRKPR